MSKQHNHFWNYVISGQHYNMSTTCFWTFQHNFAQWSDINNFSIVLLILNLLAQHRLWISFNSYEPPNPQILNIMIMILLSLKLPSSFALSYFHTTMNVENIMKIAFQKFIKPFNILRWQKCCKWVTNARSLVEYFTGQFSSMWLCVY